MKKWIISKDKRVVCETVFQYSPSVEKEMKRAGYKIKVVEDSNGTDYKHQKE